MSEVSEYRSHALMDPMSRAAKARKIIALAVGNRGRLPDRVLEIGVGSGYIAVNLARSLDAEVHGVDVVDERQVVEGFHFQLVTGPVLPYPPNYFDLIVSNHVIEHVGPEPDQERHLREAFRCLKPGGVFYLAVPNRWRLVERHYNVPILSWFPQRAASIVLRSLRLGSHYDCRPLSRSTAIAMLEEVGLTPKDVTLDAVALSNQIEPGLGLQFAAVIPKPILNLVSAITPTLIFVCHKRGG